jgi:hypothetical protein
VYDGCAAATQRGRTTMLLTILAAWTVIGFIACIAGQDF